MKRGRLIGLGVLAVAAIVLMASNGPRPVAESSGVVSRLGGVCLQLERWGLFGWAIGGQAYTETDIADGDWHSPPSSSPPCEQVPEAEYVVTLPADAAPDVYRLCGLADERGCFEFRLTAGTATAP